MLTRGLRYLGRRPGADTSGRSLRYESAPLAEGTLLALVRTRSPWRVHRPQERVILGTHPARADVLLEGEGLHPEHVRFYLPRNGRGPDDLKVIVDGTVDVNDRAVLHSEWYGLRPGDLIDLAGWRFRFERTELSSPESPAPGHPD